MILAALHGKMPSRLIESEDILTSNVFSFFRYTERTRYLKALLQLHGLDVADDELMTAEFVFWPRYDDYTEPDFVLIIGKYYILFEAKHLSDFGYETENRKCQLEREIEGGADEARSLDREFVFIAITSHYNRPTKLLDHISYNGGEKIRWMNWQAVARLLLDALESGDNIPNREFAEDLYNLLGKMKLRSFLPFYRLQVDIPVAHTVIFFPARSARYRGAFIGFKNAISACESVHAPSRCLFFQRRYFKNMPKCDTPNLDFTIGGRNNVSNTGSSK